MGTKNMQHTPFGNKFQRIITQKCNKRLAVYGVKFFEFTQ